MIELADKDLMDFNRYFKIALKITIISESSWKVISLAPKIFFSKLSWFYLQNSEARDRSSEYYIIL